MSLLDLASLVLAPTATKEGKVYSAIPDTGDGDMTFTRGSSATRVNSAGLIEKERGNLLLQSNTFDTTWATSVDITATSGQAGYDGSNDAWLLKRSSNASRFIYQNLSAGSSVYTLSFYGKPESEDWAYLYSFNGSTAITAYFDLQNGVVGTTSGSVISTNIEAAGNGYYRCSLTYNTSVSQVRIYPAVDNGSVTGGVTDAGIYIQDAQLELGLVAQSYIETTTSAVYEGITDDVPRVDYSGGGCPALKLEPQRSNLIASSEYFNSSAGWESVGSFTTNATTSPEGLVNASSLDTDYLEVRPSVVSGTDYTYSIFVKANTDTTPQIIFTGTSFPNTQANFDLSTGSVTSNTTKSAGIEDYGNGWYRIYATETATATDSTSRLRFYCQTSYIYGAQFEAGSYVSSYIPTYGVSSTRVADSCSKTGISELIGQTEGVLYAEVDLNVKPESGSPVVGILTTNNNVSDLQNCIILGVERLDAGTNSIYCLVQVSNVTQAALFGSSITSGNYKIALAYKANDFALYVNGVQVATDTSGSVPTTSQVLIGTRRNSDNFTLADRVSQAILFPTRLTNDQLEELTK